MCNVDADDTIRLAGRTLLRNEKRGRFNSFMGCNIQNDQPTVEANCLKEYLPVFHWFSQNHRGDVLEQKLRPDQPRLLLFRLPYIMEFCIIAM